MHPTILPGRSRFLLLTLAGCLLAACAGQGNAAPTDDKSAPKDNLTPVGKPKDCLTLSRIDSTNVLSDSVIDFRMKGGEIYRNTLPYSCPQLGFERRFAYKTSIGEICSVDTITVLTTGGAGGLMRGATCGLGGFQKMEKPGK